MARASPTSAQTQTPVPKQTSTLHRWQVWLGFELSSCSVCCFELLHALKMHRWQVWLGFELSSCSVCCFELLHALKRPGTLYPEIFWRFTGVSVQEEHLNCGAQHIPLMDEEHLDTDPSTDKVKLFRRLLPGSSTDLLTLYYVGPHELNTTADDLPFARSKSALLFE